TKEAPTEIVIRFGRLVCCRLCLEFFIAVERVQIALELLLIGQLLTVLEKAILRLEMRRVGTDRLRRSGGRRRRDRTRRQAADRTSGLQTRCEAFQIALLLGREIAVRGGDRVHVAVLASCLIRPVPAPQISAPASASADRSDKGQV